MAALTQMGTKLPLKLRSLLLRAELHRGREVFLHLHGLLGRENRVFFQNGLSRYLGFTFFSCFCEHTFIRSGGC